MAPARAGGVIVLRLREWRRRRGMTQVELADRAGVRQATVSDIERKAAVGELRRVDLVVMGRLARALRVEPGALLAWHPARSGTTRSAQRGRRT